MSLLEVDGCKNYSDLSEANCEGDSRCDSRLETGWYRFEGAAGERMPDKSVFVWRCGTKHPGWLNGTHPTVADGVVTRRVCYSREDDRCWLCNNIKVKNCSGYYVYESQRTPDCTLRYCSNIVACKLYSFEKLR